jgi:hypothetical protein
VVSDVKNSGTVAVLLRELGQQRAGLRQSPGSGGALGVRFDQVEAVREVEERASGLRGARGPRAGHAHRNPAPRRHRRRVTAAQPCPHCATRVAVLTTLIEQPPVPQTVLGGEHR